MKRTSIRSLTAGALSMAACVAVGATAGSESVSMAPSGKLPILKSAARVMVGNKPLTVGHTACPEVLDWNNDGKRDLLVGTFNDGKVMLFLNKGTDDAPVFGKGEALQAGGRELRVGFG
jgi:hypothetical protein